METMNTQAKLEFAYWAQRIKDVDEVLEGRKAPIEIGWPDADVARFIESVASIDVLVNLTTGRPHTFRLTLSVFPLVIIEFGLSSIWLFFWGKNDEYRHADIEAPYLSTKLYEVLMAKVEGGEN